MESTTNDGLGAAVALLATGAGMWILGALLLANWWLLLGRTRHWNETTGMVVGQHGPYLGIRELPPTYMWRDQHGIDHRGRVGWSYLYGPATGALVPIRYNPQRPTQALPVFTLTRISAKANQVGGAAVLALGTLLTLGGAALAAT